MRKTASHILRLSGVGLGVLVLVGFDQVVKVWALQHDQAVMNRGGILGIYPASGWGIGLAIVLGMMVWWGVRHALAPKWWGFWLVVIGGIANILDRFLYGAVVDMIFYPWVQVWGNVADIYLTIGVAWMGWQYMAGDHDHQVDGENHDEH